MIIEVLHIDECPSWAKAVVRTREALDQLGLGDVPVTPRLLHTPEEAAATAFAGSPTITVAGVDLFPTDGRTADLACRVYVTEQGLAGTPTAYQLVRAIGAQIELTRPSR